MDKKYTKYSVEDFTQDIKFINWVTKGIGQREWEDFIQQNPNLSKDIKLARKIISYLKISTAGLSADTSYDVYHKIETIYMQHHKKKHKIRIRKIMRYAALLILILSLGVAVPILFHQNNNFQFSEDQISQTFDHEAKLITANGKQILLKRNQSDLKLNTSGNLLKIDQDSTINLESDANQMAELVVPYGKRSNIQLSDGSKVWLNAGSKLIFPQKFTGKNRKVFLKGEAYFDVAKNKNLPFIVATDQMDIRVHGTKFNVNDIDSDDNLEVVLVEGLVGLKENTIMNLFDKEIKLVPNQIAIYNKTDKKLNIQSNVNVTYYTSWTEGLLEFNKENITSVFNRLSRFYNVRFITEGSVELNKKISGKLDLKESLEVVMKVVSDVAPITFRIDKDTVFVNSKINPLPIR